MQNVLSTESPRGLSQKNEMLQACLVILQVELSSHQQYVQYSFLFYLIGCIFRKTFRSLLSSLLNAALWSSRGRFSQLCSDDDSCIWLSENYSISLLRCVCTCPSKELSFFFSSTHHLLALQMEVILSFLNRGEKNMT